MNTEVKCGRILSPDDAFKSSMSAKLFFADGTIDEKPTDGGGEKGKRVCFPDGRMVKKRLLLAHM